MSVPAWRFASGLLLVAVVAWGCSPRVETIRPTTDTVSTSASVAAAPGDWPWWRGPRFNGVADRQDVPRKWSARENIVWKVPVRGRGHASPVVVEDRVFLITADEVAETMSLICLDRATGESLWDKTVHQGGFMRAHKKNSQASSTPAWDGQRVFVVFMVDGGIFVTAADKQGEILWQKNAGKFSSKHGYGSSPLLYRSLVIVSGDNQGQGFLAALDRVSGKIVWRVAREDNASFGTPVIANIDGSDQLLLSGHNQVCSYNPSDGTLRWKSAEGPAASTANTMAWHEGLVFASGGWPEHNVMALRADGSGKVVWRKGIKAYVPSPLMVGNRLLVTQDTNILRCYEPATGKELWSKRVGERGYSASPTAVGDVVYLPDEEGNVHVFRVGEQFESIAENKLEGTGMASPVICGGRIYLRTSSHLYCIGN